MTAQLPFVYALAVSGSSGQDILVVLPSSVLREIARVSFFRS
jgi:hypothetical protein